MEQALINILIGGYYTNILVLVTYVGILIYAMHRTTVDELEAASYLVDRVPYSTQLQTIAVEVLVPYGAIYSISKKFTLLQKCNFNWLTYMRKLTDVE